MKRIPLLALFLLIWAVPAFATDLSIQSTSLTWNATQTTNLQLWICSSDSWVDVDGELHGPSSPDNRTFTFRVTGITYNSGTQSLTIPAFSLTPTRNAITGNTVRLFFWIVQTNGTSVTKLKMVPGTENGLTVPATIASTSGCTPAQTCATFSDLISYNASPPSLPPATYPTFDDMTRAIDAAVVGTASAPLDAPYVLKQPTSGLDNAFALSTLSTGLLKVTTVSGMLTTAVGGTDYQGPISVTSPLTFNSNVVAMPAATGSVNGYLTSADWTTFNGKQAALGFTPENLANKNASSGYAGLSGGKVANSQISEVLAPADLTGVSGVQGTGATLPIGTFSSLVNGQAVVWDSGTSNFINATVGSVTSVAMTVPSWLTVSGSPITGSGTLAVTATSGQSANSVLATPDGSSGALSVRALLNGDLPTVNAAHGGSGLASYTAHSLLAAGTTSTGNYQQITPATAGLVLTANGAGALPSFQSLPAASAHNLLGSSHSDTTASSPPARGSVITAQGSGTASWAEKVKGTQYQTVQANATDTVFDAVHLDQAAAVTGTLPVASGGTGATTFTTNAVLYGNGTGAIQAVLGGAGTLCLQSVDGAAPVFGACSGSAATAWSSLTAPGSNLSISHTTRTTTFTWGTGLSADAFTLQDTTGSASTNHILLVSSVGTSTMKPVAFTAQGTSNGVEMSTAGILAPIGTGGITANALNGVSGNGIQVRTSAGNFASRTLTDAAGITWTNGDGVSGNPSAALNLATLVASQTIFDGSQASRTITFNLSGTDPVLTLSSSAFNVSTGTIQQAGTPVVLETRTLINGTGINTLGDLSANRTVSIDQSFAPVWTGVHTFTPAARSSGAAAFLTVNAPTDTNLTADTEAIGVSFVSATRQHADGTTQTNQREYVFARPTYSAAGTSVITNAATLAITDAPAAGTNMTLTNKHALWIQAGQSQLDGRVVFGTTPVYDLGSSTLAVDAIVTHTSVTIPTSGLFYHIRLSQTSGDYNTFTVGSAGTAVGFGSFVKSLSGSNAASDAYAAVFQTSNEGPGTTKSAHFFATAVSGSTGVLAAASFDVSPVTGQGTTFPIQVATSGITNHSTGILFSTNNSTNFKYGIDLYGVNTFPGYNLGAIRLPYSTWVVARNSGGSADQSLFRLATVDSVADTIEAAANLNITSTNAYFKLSTGSNAWTFQVIDSTSAFRILRSGIGDALGISATGITNLWKGSTVTAASTITATGNLFHTTGATTITAISGTNIVAGTTITIITDTAVQFTNGANLKMAGTANYTTTAGTALTFVYDGSSVWQEIARAQR